MAYWAKDGSFVREASDDTPIRTQGDDLEAKQRIIKNMEDSKREEEIRKVRERESRIEFHEIRKTIEQQRADALNYERDKRQAVRSIVEQKRKEYNDRSWFGKLIAKATGNTFANQKNEIEEYATIKVENMNPRQTKTFIENNSEEIGRSR